MAEYVIVTFEMIYIYIWYIYTVYIYIYVIVWPDQLASGLRLLNIPMEAMAHEHK